MSDAIKRCICLLLGASMMLAGVGCVAGESDSDDLEDVGASEQAVIVVEDPGAAQQGEGILHPCSTESVDGDSEDPEPTPWRGGIAGAGRDDGDDGDDPDHNPMARSISKVSTGGGHHATQGGRGAASTLPSLVLKH